ncbi:MAG TPA: tetratricopeptide repeat protein [Rhizomicrobium sp.]|jgi:tetratricopeptide (TPR) repeat protein|nr:tetratricopeptide repeat protein [Rhizomicrobium sp.]
MADEDESGHSGTGDPAAIHVALDAATAATAEARAYLRKQARLAELQIDTLEKKDEFELSHLRWRRFNDQMKGALQIMLVAVAALIVAGLGATVWSAANDKGLVIEAFSVPPDMAARGLTGQAIAAQLQDKLAALQDQTESARPADSYANNWGDDIKVQIPDTGVSVGEFYRLLAAWLGHETHITGEVYRDAGGLAIVARAGGDGGTTVLGREADFDGLMQQSAEAIYARTQPYRYAVYSESQGRPAQARAIYRRLAVEGAAPRDRAWAYVGLGVLDVVADDGYGAVDASRQAVAIVPDFALGWSDIDNSETGLAHDEAALAAARVALRLMTGSGDVDMTPRARAITTWQSKNDIDNALGDFTAALRDGRQAAGLADFSGLAETAREATVQALAALHDDAAARRGWDALPAADDPPERLLRSIGALGLDYWLDDWRALLPQRDVVRKNFETVLAQHLFIVSSLPTLDMRLLRPAVANAMAATGDFAGAHAMIDKTPLDCLICLRSRGRIAALARNWAGADYWFSRAAAFAPSIPFSYSDWGRMLLAKGDYDAAIAKFALANRKGPHFADPLEMWGEALVAQNRSDLALAKFAEAARNAPNWGRLHLKWGEALLWSGDKAGAARQFAVARTLDLAPSEKSELARVRAHG